MEKRDFSGRPHCISVTAYSGAPSSIVLMCVCVCSNVYVPAIGVQLVRELLPNVHGVHQHLRLMHNDGKSIVVLMALSLYLSDTHTHIIPFSYEVFLANIRIYILYTHSSYDNLPYRIIFLDYFIIPWPARNTHTARHI